MCYVRRKKERDKTNVKKEYIAHKKDTDEKIQTIKEHSDNTAKLCEQYIIPELGNIGYVLGKTHDIGKYQQGFQDKMDGKPIRIEHSICGASVVREAYMDNPIGLMMQYCIAGHHSGLPDGGTANDDENMSTLYGRLKRKTEDYSAYKTELELPDTDWQAEVKFLIRDCRQDDLNLIVDKFAFLTRYCFSCLVDADSEDTAHFCQEPPYLEEMTSNFAACLNKVNNRLQTFIVQTELQKARSVLQKQVFEKIHKEAEIFLMNMPTGSGKTLCSVKFALEKAIRDKKRRIIYVIPFNSIIGQTVKVFQNIFGEDVQILRHQSTYSYEEEGKGEDYKLIVKHATENWSADFIVTTMVQFFESLYSNKRGKLRKLHNMADSILIFDEAHLMPVKFLQPCLQGVAFITKYLNSEAIFLTATMPDFSKLIKEYALPGSKIENLIDDVSAFTKFKKCKYEYIGSIGMEELLRKSKLSASSLIVVNKKKTAQELMRLCTGKKYHLSKYLTSYDIERILQDIHEDLEDLERKYPGLRNVPPEERITIISTSLIEAGVDLDVETVFRQMTGLDSILQAGGRCNREGKRENARTYIFELGGEGLNQKENLTKGLLEKYEDISDLKCIEEYYNRLYAMEREEIEMQSIHNDYQNIRSIGFKTYAEKFRMIDSAGISLVVCRDEESRKLVNELRYTGVVNERKLQKYTCSISASEWNDLLKQKAIDDFGTGIYCLTNLDYYDVNLGITFEATDYFL